MEPDELFPRRVFLKDDPSVTVARVGLGLTLYLDDPGYWASEGAELWFHRFVRLVDPRVAYFTTSRLDHWNRVSDYELGKLGDELRATQSSARHLLEFCLVDDRGAPRVGFIYREVSPDRKGRTGHLQLLFAHDWNPDDLLALALELGHQAPIRCGVGGWLARWNREIERTSFKQIHLWCRRYLGLDVQVPDQMAYHVRQALPSVSWITLIGESLVPTLEDAVDLEGLPDDVSVMRLKRALLIRAGEAPTLGDSNSLEYPSAMSAVSKRLEPMIIAEPPPFPEGFGSNGETTAWTHRFASPETWE